MYLSLSVNIHQSYRFKMNDKFDISNWRMSKNPKIPAQIERRFGFSAFAILLGRSQNILLVLG